MLLAEFFQIGPLPLNQMYGSYDPRLVVLSYLVAMFASFIALDIAGRLRDVSNTEAANLFWIVGGAIAMGSGIWTMHFVGMLSFSMPEMTMHYDIYWTGLSLLVAVFASGFALFLLKAREVNVKRLVVGGVILGLGIASMHYAGMQAMKIEMNVHYTIGLFILSIIIAITASEVALWLALKTNQVVLKYRTRLKLISAAIMGVAICGMHYTGMMATVFTPIPGMTHIPSSLDPTILSMTIAGVTFVILSIAFLVSTYKEALNQQQLEKARQLGIEEVSASVLHNVGNVLNSVKVSAHLVSEKIEQTKLNDLENLQQLFAAHQNDLADYLTKDPQGKKIPAFINYLASYWNDEKKALANEISSLTKNIDHIKDIISMHQSLTRAKAKEIEHIVSLNDAMSEALMITGLNDYSKDILIEKDFEKLHPILVDKVKLLQIFVNLLMNAKDAVKETPQPKKLITLKCILHGKDRVLVQVIDNGVGISPENCKKMFSHGFTTKKTGHGYGLHTSALAANEMGGSIRAESEGAGKGAKITLELPYRLPK